MDKQLSAEYKMLQRAQRFLKGELEAENQKAAKLLRRIGKNPNAWLETYSRFNNLTWTSEIFVLGLNEEEQLSLISMLEEMGIKGIVLGSSEGYKALAVSAVQRHCEQVHHELQALRGELEHELKAVLRYDPRGIVVSGYKRGWPFTSYITENEYHHKFYIDNLGRFETVARVNESRLGQQDELRFALYKVERCIPRIKESWEIWKREEQVKLRLENLEKYSDTLGALS